MLRDPYRYALALEHSDHTSLGQFTATMDWGPACEWARFAALRDQHLIRRGAARGLHAGRQQGQEGDFLDAVEVDHVLGPTIRLTTRPAAGSPPTDSSSPSHVNAPQLY